MPAGSKYKHLLEDQDVRRWYENLEAKSVITATVYLRTLGLYCGLKSTYTLAQILRGFVFDSLNGQSKISAKG